jgi:hypothetical protein
MFVKNDTVETNTGKLPGKGVFSNRTGLSHDMRLFKLKFCNVAIFFLERSLKTV